MIRLAPDEKRREVQFITMVNQPYSREVNDMSAMTMRVGMGRNGNFGQGGEYTHLSGME